MNRALSARQQRAEQAGKWLTTMPEGSASPGELGAALSLNHARQAETMSELRAQGWVEGPKGQISLNAAGWARFGGDLETNGAGDVLEDLLDGWPQPYRAFVQLLVSALVARHHLSEHRPSGHLSFVALGETGTGKSALARLVCDLFAWPVAEHELQLPMQSAGSLLGRRNETPQGWVWEPAAATRLPFLLLDEVDKATEPVRRLAMIYAHGESQQSAEGQVHDLHPTVMLAANPPRSSRERYDVVRPEYRRRSAVLDTGFMRSRRTEVEQLLRAHYDRTPRPRLSLDRLTVPQGLSPGALATIGSLMHVLTSAGAEEFPGTRSLELAALGRCALIGPGADDRLAAVSVAIDYLHVTETVPGQIRRGWQQEAGMLRHHFGADADVLVAALERGKAEQAAAVAAVTQQRTQRQVADLETVEAAHRLKHRLQVAYDALDGRRLASESEAVREEAGGLRPVLKNLATKAANTSAAATLGDLEALAERPLSRALALIKQAAVDKQRRESDRADEKRQAEHDRSWGAQQAKAAQQERRRAADAHADALREQLRLIRNAAEPLEALYRRRATRHGESPLDELRRQRVDGRPLLRWERPPRTPEPPQASGTVRKVTHALVQGALAARTGPAAGRWVVAGSGARFPGGTDSCPALSEWGPNTRAVLEPMLRTLHAAEDGAVVALGARGRSRRRPVLGQDYDGARSLELR